MAHERAAPIGVAISGGLTASQTVSLAALAESLGYESVWVAEGHGGDQFAILAARSASTGCPSRSPRRSPRRPRA
jgi:alkanesulfonate monooxygenase SsuD/methylene tetrahydromethanopterin reductase-like flavin-dependent oxidoreductase (luciferase family)